MKSLLKKILMRTNKMKFVRMPRSSHGRVSKRIARDLLPRKLRKTERRKPAKSLVTFVLRCVAYANE